MAEAGLGRVGYYCTVLYYTTNAGLKTTPKGGREREGGEKERESIHTFKGYDTTLENRTN